MIDQINRKILSILQKNARTSNAEIARQVGMAPSAVLERIRKMERSGVIQGYETRVDPKALDLGVTAFTKVRVDEAVGSTDMGEQLSAIPGVLEVHYCAGEDHYLIKVRASDPEGLAQVLGRIGQHPMAKYTNSTIVLRTVRETISLPLDGKE